MPSDVSCESSALEQEVSRSGAVVTHLLPPLAIRPPASGQRSLGLQPENQGATVTDPSRMLGDPLSSPPGQGGFRVENEDPSV
jgi:hypothetical protein